MSRITIGAVAVSIYGHVLIVEGLVVALREGASDARHLLIHIIGGVCWLLLGWGISQRYRPAWIVSVVFTGVLLLAGTAALAIVAAAGVNGDRMAAALRVGQLWIPLGVLSILSVMTAFVSLIAPSTRREFAQRVP